MSNDAMTVLWLLGCGLYLGWKACERFGGQGTVLVPVPAGVVPLEHHTTQSLCRCARCAPAFMQESPHGEQ